MRHAFVVLPIGIALGLAACVSTPDESAEPRSPVAAELSSNAPPISPEEELPATSVAGIVLTPPRKAPIPHPSASGKSGVMPARQPDVSIVKVVERNAPSAAAVVPVAVMHTKEHLPGPAWLKGCHHRQQQANAIMCDADSLLVPPSDKVMVYVRDAKLSRILPSGHSIQLREGLPRLYRIFALE